MPRSGVQFALIRTISIIHALKELEPCHLLVRRYRYATIVRFVQHSLP